MKTADTRLSASSSAFQDAPSAAGRDGVGVIAPAQELEEMEYRLVLDAIRSYYGFEFSEYRRTSFRSKLREHMSRKGLSHVSGLIEHFLHDHRGFDLFLHSLSEKPDSFFRDPAYIQAFRTMVAPLLRTYPSLRFWLPCCGRGEEAYSLAILLKEEALYDRSTIYATEISEMALDNARIGEFDASMLEQHRKQYLAGGFKKSFDDYYELQGERFILNQDLKKNILFAQHNLATDGSFNEFHVIICRERMKEFSETLQTRIQGLFRESLVRHGVLWLGASDHLCPPGVKDEYYHELGETLKIFRRYH